MPVTRQIIPAILVFIFSLLLLLFVGILEFGREAPLEKADSPSTQLVSTLDLSKSNIRPQDYAGPDKCQRCHAQQYEQWRNHPHRRMNLNALPDSVVGDFNSRRIPYAGHDVVFEARDTGYFMTMLENQQPVRQYRVTRTVGSRVTQMYIGVQTLGPEPKSHPCYQIEGKLPFGYWMQRNTWTPENYFDVDTEKEHDEPELRWNRLARTQQNLQWDDNCLQCHNTFAYQHRIALGAGLGFPLADIESRLSKESIAAFGTANSRNLITVGISCESCHFGCRDHAEHNTPVSYVPTSPQFHLKEAALKHHGSGAKSSWVVNSICAQCHRAEAVIYPNGAAAVNSREALDFMSGGCASSMKCTDCHSPHTGTRHGGLKSDTDITATCIRCHSSYESPDARASHTRHSTSVQCIDCHMPRIVQGLDNVVRSHHIHSPNHPVMFAAGGPNACNLCHLDRSARWTINELSKGWKLQLNPEILAPVHGPGGDLPMGKVWLNHGDPLVRLVAAEAVSSASIGKTLLPELLRTLTDPHPLNRMFGLFAVERLTGVRFSESEYNPLNPAVQRSHQVEIMQKKLNKPE